MKKLTRIKPLVTLAALLILAGLVVPGIALAGDQPEGKPFQVLWDAVNGLSERIDNEGMPAGAIIMWSGTIDTNGNPVIGGTADTNWQICDATNGTPDLRDRFVVGSGGSYTTGDTGGVNSVTLNTGQMPRHSHYFSATTSTGGYHNHSYYDRWHQGDDSADHGNKHVGTENYTDWSKTTNWSGSHSHNVSGNTRDTGGNASHENRPLYYALAFIMKVQ